MHSLRLYTRTFNPLFNLLLILSFIAHNLGSVFVGLKDAVIQPSSPFRHMCELYQIINNLPSVKPVLFIYTDGGPDHRLTYLSVKLSLVCLYLKLNLDYLCAGRTAPFHSWRNPVERIMSILNLGLQCVGVARQAMPVEYEEVNKCNSLKALRNIVSRKSGIVEAVKNCLSPLKSLLSSVFCRLKLHDDYISVYEAASVSEISDFWTVLIALDATLKEGDKLHKDDLHLHPNIQEFLTHCCKSSKYTFDIIKCGTSSCKICKPVRLPFHVFQKLRHIPHPVLGKDNHYKPFSDVYNEETTDNCPSLLIDIKKKKNSLPFYGYLQHVKNAQIVIQCSECDKWRLVFSKYKLSSEERQELQAILDSFIYTCGSQKMWKLEFMHVMILSRSYITQLILNQFVYIVELKRLIQIQEAIHNAHTAQTSLLLRNNAIINYYYYLKIINKTARTGNGKL